MPVFHPSAQDPISQSWHDAWVCITLPGKLPFTCHVLSTVHAWDLWPYGTSNMLCTQHTSECCPHPTVISTISASFRRKIYRSASQPSRARHRVCCNWLIRRWTLHLVCRCLCLLSLGQETAITADMPSDAFSLHIILGVSVHRCYPGCMDSTSMLTPQACSSWAT